MQIFVSDATRALQSAFTSCINPQCKLLRATYHVFKITLQPECLGSEIIKHCLSSRVTKAPLSFPLGRRRAEE